MAAGTVTLKVVPNADDFHNKAKRQIEQKKISPVGVKIDPDTKEWEKLKQDVKNFDNTFVNIRLKVDSRALEDTLREIEKSDQTIERRLDLDTTEAQKKLDDLSEVPQTEDGAIKRVLLVDHTFADEQMLGFEQKWETPIERTVTVDVDGMEHAQRSFENLGSTMDQIFNQSGGRQIAGIRNLVSVESALLDTQNIIPRMMKSMNAQMDLGMRQIYDKYIDVVARMYRATSKPFIDVRGDFNAARNFEDFFGRLADRAEEARRKLDGFSNSTKAGLANLRDFHVEIIKLPKNFLVAAQRISFAWNLMRKNMPDSLLPTIPNKTLRDVYRNIRYVAMLPRDMAREVKDMGEIVARVIGSKVASAFGTAKKAASGFGLSVRDALRDIGSGAKASLREIRSGAGMVAQALGSFIPGQVIAAAKSAGERFATPFFNSISRGVGRGINALGSFYSAFQFLAEDIGGKMGPALLRGLGDSGRTFKQAVSDMFSGVARTASRVFGKSKNIFSGLTSGIKYMGKDLNRSLLSPLAKFSGRAAKYLTLPFVKMTQIVGRSTVVFGAVRKVMGRISNVAMGASRAAIGAFAKLAGFLTSALVPAIMAAVFGIMAMGGQAVLGAIMAVGGAIQSAIGGALAMLPALAAAAGASFAVLKIGTEGLGDAFKSAFSAETAEEFEEAISGLPPAMQAISRSLREFKPMWDETVKGIQNNMFEGLDDNFNAAIGSLLPIFSKSAQTMATSWNRAFEGVLDNLSSVEAQAGVAEILSGTEQMAEAMEPVLGNLVNALGMLATEGAKFLGPIGQWAADKSNQFASWAESLREIDPETGRSYFDGIVESAKVNAGHLGNIFGGIFGTLGNVFKAGAEGGQGMLGGMGAAMQELKTYTSEGNAGFESMVDFMERAAALGSQLGLVMAPLLDIFTDVFGVLATVGEGAIAGAGSALESIATGLEGYKSVALGFGKDVGAIFESLGPLLENFLVAAQPVVDGLAEGLRDMVVPIAEGLTPAFETLVDIGPVLGNILETTGEALGKIGEALGPLIESGMELFGQLLEPLERVVFWIGELFTAVIEVLSPFFELRDDAVGGLIENLTPLIDVLGMGLTEAVRALSPLFESLGKVFSYIIEAITPIIPVLTQIAFVLFEALIDVIEAVMPIVPPLAEIIMDFVDLAVYGLMQALKFLLDLWQRVWPTMSSLLEFIVNSVLIPVIDLLKAVFKAWWEFIKWGIDTVVIPILKLFSSVAEGVFNFVKWAIENVVAPAVDFFVDLFKGAVSGVTSIWEGLKKVFAKPIRFFIETVINDGIVPAWNRVMGWIGKEDEWGWEGLKVPEALNFHSGGVLPGHSVGKDNLHFRDQYGRGLNLAGGEGIMRQEFVSAVGGKKGIDKLNEDARHGRLKMALPIENHATFAGQAGYPGYANGGVIDAMMRIVRAKYPMLTMTSGYRPGDSGNHGAGLATDWSNGSGNTPQQLALARDIAKTYPGSRELIYDAPGWSGNIAHGQNVGAFGGYFNLAQAGPHHHHVHWAMSTPPTMPFGGGVFEGGDSGGVGGFINPIPGYIDKLKGLFSGISEKLSPEASKYGTYGKLVLGAGERVVDGVIDAATDKLKSMAQSLISAITGGGDSVDLSDISGSLVASVEEVFSRHGFTGEQWEAAKWIINRESGWNPTAQNPSSTAYGLFQFLDSTWAEVGASKTSDPVLQADAGAKYMKGRYGNPVGAKAFWEQNGWYDQGGEANGIGVMQKNVLQPERVLSPPQTRAFNDFVYGLMPELIRSFKKNPADIGGLLNKLNRGVGEITRELREGTIAGFQSQMLGTFRKRLDGKQVGNPLDTNYDSGWFDRNGQKLQANLGKAVNRAGAAFFSPKEYLEAEERAKAKLDAEIQAKEEAKKKAEEEKKRAQEEAKRKAEEKAKEKKKSTSKPDSDSKKVADKVSDVETAVDSQTKKLSKAEEEKQKKDEEARRKAEQAEQKRIEKAKADGSYYYGYKVFNEQGKRPEEIKRTPEEVGVRGFLDSVGDRTGLGETFSNLGVWFDDFRAVGEAAAFAVPAWIAAVNGDPSGLAHNVAVGQAQVVGMGVKGVADLAPDAIAGIVEMAISGSSAGGNNAPFIGQVNSGMTQAELMQTLETYEMRRSRKGTGTTRVR